MSSPLPPRICIVIPTFNRGDLLPRAIESIRNQDFQDWELAIVDDGSTDNTREIVLGYHDDRVIYHVLDSKRGANSARNVGTSLSPAPILTFLDSDDEARPGWLSSISEGFRDNGVGVVTTGHVSVSPDNRETEKPIPDMGAIFDHVVANFHHSGTWAVRRSIFEAIGGFEPRLRASQHTEIALRLVPYLSDEGWKIACVDRPMIRYFENSADGIRKDDAAVLSAAEFLIERYGRLIEEKSPKGLAGKHAVAGFRAARLGLRARAQSHFRLALRYGGRHPRALARFAFATALWPFRPQSWRPDKTR